MKNLADLKVKIFADGADKAGILEMYAHPFISGFTTNPTLMRKAGINDFESFAREILSEIPDRPVSVEVFADDFSEMERQADRISSWADNVYVKIPVTNTLGQSSADLVRRLAAKQIHLNVTAVMTLEQVTEMAAALALGVNSYISVFAGRIADTGVDPIPLMTDSVRALAKTPHVELIWASPRELLNIYHADEIGCHIITVTNDILAKLPLIGKDLREYSLDTVKMFHSDATKAGYSIETTRQLSS